MCVPSLPSQLAATLSFRQTVERLCAVADLQRCVGRWVAVHGDPPPSARIATELPCPAANLEGDTWEGKVKEASE